MKIIEGLARIQRYWPDVTFKMGGEERLGVMYLCLDQVAQGPDPETIQELIRIMDQAGLEIRGHLVVLSD